MPAPSTQPATYIVLPTYNEIGNLEAMTRRILEVLPDARIDVMMVTDIVNVRYLTGYTGSNGLALIGPQTRTFITDFRYVEQAAEEMREVKA